MKTCMCALTHMKNVEMGCSFIGVLKKYITTAYKEFKRLSIATKEKRNLIDSIVFCQRFDTRDNKGIYCACYKIRVFHFLGAKSLNSDWQVLTLYFARPLSAECWISMQIFSHCSHDYNARSDIEPL